MKSQSLTITGRSFYKFRALMDASLEKAVEKMLAAGVSEGTVSGQITIKLDRSVNDETGEVTIRPRFVFTRRTRRRIQTRENRRRMIRRRQLMILMMSNKKESLPTVDRSRGTARRPRTMFGGIIP